MKAGNLKGALLEYIISRLLINCGFSKVKEDGVYIFKDKGLFFINGKGAAHDADVLMDPPIQMPFAYPSRLLFECKAYSSKVGLPVVRNALGLRNDINDFEIVTEKSLKERKNNRRADYAIANRKRHFYQIGVASLNGFTKSATEFAANHKIPLLSLDWFFPEYSLELFEKIDQRYVDSLNADVVEILFKYLKTGEDYTINFEHFKETDEIIGKILKSLDLIIHGLFVGLIETGDILFLFPNQKDSFERFESFNRGHFLKAKLHYYREEPNIWRLEVFEVSELMQKATFKFHLPKNLVDNWTKENYDRVKALDMKAEFFSRIFIFPHKNDDQSLPYYLLTIDSEWLNKWRRTEGIDDIL